MKYFILGVGFMAMVNLVVIETVLKPSAKKFFAEERRQGYISGQLDMGQSLIDLHQPKSGK